MFMARSVYSDMTVVLHLVVLCRFMLRSYATHTVLPVSYSWSTFTGPVSGEVREVKSPWKQQSSTSYVEYKGSGDGSDLDYNPDYVARPHYSFAYGVDNPNTGDSHGHSETREGSKVTGEYSVMEPDGVLRRVLYSADPKNGFRASVRYVRPDGESSGHDHGYYGHDQGINSSPPPPSQLSEYESNDDEPYESPLSPQSLHYGYNNEYNNNNNGDYEEEGGPSSFKFPTASSPSPFFKTANSDSDDYSGSDRYYHWGSFGSASTQFDERPPSSQSPFGLPSTPKPSYGRKPPSYDGRKTPSYNGRPLSFGNDGTASSPSPFISYPRRPSPIITQPCATPSSSRAGRPRRRRPSKSSVTANIVSHSSEYRKPSTDDDDDDEGPEPFRSLDVDFGDDDDHDDIENYEANDDDNDTDTADAADVELTPSVAKSSRPSSSSSTPTPRSRPVTSPTTPSSPSPSPSPYHRSSSQSPMVAVQLSPSSTMTPIEPTIIDI